MAKFYKLAHPTGWDFYTFNGKGGTINYRESIGKHVVCPDYDRKGQLCSRAFIHASREPDQCFVGAKIPCSAYLVSGRPVAEDEQKCGFRSLRIIKELNPEKLFGWNYREATNLTHPFEIKPPKKITDEHMITLKQWDSVRASVWDSVWDSVRASVWASVWDSVRASVWDSVRASVWAYIGYLFGSLVKSWKYIKHEPGQYPFQPAVDLWKAGLVPSYDGMTWRLHCGKKATIVCEVDDH